MSLLSKNSQTLVEIHHSSEELDGLGRAGNVVRRWLLLRDERRKGEEGHGLPADGEDYGKT